MLTTTDRSGAANTALSTILTARRSVQSVTCHDRPQGMQPRVLPAVVGTRTRTPIPVMTASIPLWTPATGRSYLSLQRTTPLHRAVSMKALRRLAVGITRPATDCINPLTVEPSSIPFLRYGNRNRIPWSSPAWMMERWAHGSAPPAALSIP